MSRAKVRKAVGALVRCRLDMIGRVCAWLATDVADALVSIENFTTKLLVPRGTGQCARRGSAPLRVLGASLGWAGDLRTAILQAYSRKVHGVEWVGFRCRMSQCGGMTYVGRRFCLPLRIPDLR
jgi:hypothetical protein